MNHANDGFDDVINNGYAVNPQPQFIDPNPYGGQVQPVKTGLTKRGKVALAVGATVLATGGLISWQHYSAVNAANQAKAQELQLQKAKIDLETLKEMNRASTANSKQQDTADTARQKQIDACVNDNKGLVGKQLGATYRSVLEDCQAQYQATTSTDDMQAASASEPASGGGGSVNEGLLIGGAVLAGGVYIVARKNKASNPA